VKSKLLKENEDVRVLTTAEERRIAAECLLELEITFPGLLQDYVFDILDIQAPLPMPRMLFDLSMRAQSRATQTLYILLVTTLTHALLLVSRQTSSCERATHQGGSKGIKKKTKGESGGFKPDLKITDLNDVFETVLEGQESNDLRTSVASGRGEDGGFQEKTKSYNQDLTSSSEKRMSSQKASESHYCIPDSCLEAVRTDTPPPFPLPFPASKGLLHYISTKKLSEKPEEDTKKRPRFFLSSQRPLSRWEKLRKVCRWLLDEGFSRLNGWGRAYALQIVTPLALTVDSANVFAPKQGKGTIRPLALTLRETAKRIGKKHDAVEFDTAMRLFFYEWDAAPKLGLNFEWGSRLFGEIERIQEASKLSYALEHHCVLIARPSDEYVITKWLELCALHAASLHLKKELKVLQEALVPHGFDSIIHRQRKASALLRSHKMEIAYGKDRKGSPDRLSDGFLQDLLCGMGIGAASASENASRSTVIRRVVMTMSLLAIDVDPSIAKREINLLLGMLDEDPAAMRRLFDDLEMVLPTLRETKEEEEEEEKEKDTNISGIALPHLSGAFGVTSAKKPITKKNVKKEEEKTPKEDCKRSIPLKPSSEECIVPEKPIVSILGSEVLFRVLDGEKGISWFESYLFLLVHAVTGGGGVPENDIRRIARATLKVLQSHVESPGVLQGWRPGLDLLEVCRALLITPHALGDVNPIMPTGNLSKLLARIATSHSDVDIRDMAGIYFRILHTCPPKLAAEVALKISPMSSRIDRIPAFSLPLLSLLGSSYFIESIKGGDDHGLKVGYPKLQFLQHSNAAKIIQITPVRASPGQPSPFGEEEVEGGLLENKSSPKKSEDRDEDLLYYEYGKGNAFDLIPPAFFDYTASHERKDDNIEEKDSTIVKRPSQKPQEESKSIPPENLLNDYVHSLNLPEDSSSDSQAAHTSHTHLRVLLEYYIFYQLRSPSTPAKKKKSNVSNQKDVNERTSEEKGSFPKQMFGVMVQLHTTKSYAPLRPITLPYLRQRPQKPSEGTSASTYARFPYVYRFTIALLPRFPAPSSFRAAILFNDEDGNTCRGPLEPLSIKFSDLLLPLPIPESLKNLWGPRVLNAWKEYVPDSGPEELLRSMTFELMWHAMLRSSLKDKHVSGVESVKLLVLPKAHVIGRIRRYLSNYVVRHASLHERPEGPDRKHRRGKSDADAAQYDVSTEVLSTITSVRMATFLPPKYHLLIKFRIGDSSTLVRMRTDQSLVFEHVDTFFDNIFQTPELR